MLVWASSLARVVHFTRGLQCFSSEARDERQSDEQQKLSKNKNLAFAVIRLDDVIEPKIIDMLNGIEELKFVHQINLKDY